MRYTKQESEIFLRNMQDKLDETGKTISFAELWIKTKPKNINYVVGTALNLHPTQTNGKVHTRKQKIGHSRSLQDLYLLVKYYFPEATIFDVVEDLQKRKDRDELQAMFCFTHSKTMFRKGHDYYHNIKDLSHYGIF